MFFVFAIIAFISVFVVVVTLSLANQGYTVKTKSKFSSLDTKTGILLFCSGVALVIFSSFALYTFTTRGMDDASESTVADGFTIESFDVTLDVSEDNKVEVEETILIDFYEPGHHGIYRFVPSWLMYTDKDGNTESRKAYVSKLKAKDENYIVETVGSQKKRIKIGESDKTVPVGLKYYNISYSYDFGGDIYEDFDEFIFHAFGDYWGTEIKNAKVIIKLPEKIDLKEEDIRFFADKKREEDITKYVNVQIDGRVITATLMPNYQLNKSLTVDVVLPDGYFTDAESIGGVYGYFSLTICILCIIIAIIIFFFWLRYGKDLNPEVETVEFYPPYGLDAAEIGYLYKGESGRKLTVATIINLAAKGYIKIHESEDKEITIQKNVDLSLDEAIRREITITKLKKFKKDTPGITEEASKLMSKLSGVGSEYVITNDFDNKINDMQCLIDNGFIEVKHDTLNDYTEEAITNIKKSIEEKNKNDLVLSSTEKIIFNALFEDSSVVVLSEHKTLYKSFTDVSNTVKNKYEDKINDITSHKVATICSLWLFIAVILWGIAFMFIKDLGPKYDYLYLIAYISLIVGLIFNLLMKRKTQYGEEVKAKIAGFKNYLEVARKEQLEMLVEENPNYFYDILPFAYVLDVSKKWIEKFENISIPENDWGGINYFDTSAFDHIGLSVYSPTSSGGSSSGCGGGCSSCGGGCSSCGGGGSW